MTIGNGSKQEEAEKAAPIRAATPDALEDAANLIKQGELVGIPTETVYGLAADATNARAVARIFEAKGRPRFNPLISHVSSLAAAQALGTFSPVAERLARAFWPGPLTLVVPRTAECPVCDLASAGLTTIALRVPSHPVAAALLVAAGVPLAAPSANRSGHVSATSAAHVAADLGGRLAMILDAGPARLGVESTVLAVRGDDVTLLRPGAIPTAAIEALLGHPVARDGAPAKKPLSPGQLDSHYAPEAPLRLNATEVRAGEALLAFGKPLGCEGETLNLSPGGDLVEAAANLFAYLRRLDAATRTGIAVMPIPSIGLGEAINDRLQRAAAPRPDRS